SKVESNLASNKINVVTGGKSKIVKHKVKKGENLAQIANKYNVSIDEVKATNKLRTDKVKYGTTLKIATNTLANNPSPNVETDDKPVSAKLHKVNQGETLAQIARNYGTSADN